MLSRPRLRQRLPMNWGTLQTSGTMAEGPPDYVVDDVRCTLPDGKTAHYKSTGGGMLVAAKGGSWSGNDECIMRYD